MRPPAPHDPLVHSYLYLRRAVGLLGMALPLVLVVGGLLLTGELLGSISGYYYSGLRDVYVGAMCATGVFLLCYRGYGRVDDATANAAGIAAIGVALFPTRPVDPDARERVFGHLHLVSAAVFFLALAFFCLVLFRRTDATAPTGRKLKRNAVYLVSGVVILVCLVLIPVTGALFDLGALRPALWLESLAILAFGVAWLTKGQVILGDVAD